VGSVDVRKDRAVRMQCWENYTETEPRGRDVDTKCSFTVKINTQRI
jgi:hypothetical protein